MSLLIVFGVLLLLYVGLVVAINRNRLPHDGPTAVSHSGKTIDADQELRIMTWNLGYAGLGAESDFVIDGGKHFLPPSKTIVQKNRAGIVQHLKDHPVDIALLQEVAEPGLLSRGVDLAGYIAETVYHGMDRSFHLDMSTALIPPPLRFAHGSAIYSNRKIKSARTSPLPVEPKFAAGIIKKMYVAHIAEIPIAGRTQGWIIMNIHLAAFDDNATARTAQLQEVLDIAAAYYDAGNYVVVGGDWNLEFEPSTMPHNTASNCRFWIHPFPKEMVPEGWTLATDTTNPTVRTVHQPYARGENYTTYIDGFLTSPNVSVRALTTQDLQFAFSDHQPVGGTFVAQH